MNAAAAREQQRLALIPALSDAWGMIGNLCEQAYDYLDAYGYTEVLSSLSVEQVAKAVMKFQAMFGSLKVDGIVGPKTLRAMEMPRCGCVDVRQMGGTINKWGIKKVSYGWASYLPQLSVADQKNIWESIVTPAWEEVCDFEFRPAESGETPNLLIHATSLRRAGFGRPGGVLADEELPPTNDWRGQLNMRFDIAEPWKIERNRVGIVYGTVAIHEGGHFLGIDHNEAGTGIMAAFYNESVDKPQPGYDYDQAQMRYGKPQAPPTPGGGEPPSLCRVTSSGATWEAMSWKRVA